MEVRHMANKKNSAPADEDKVRTAVRRTLKWGLPLTPDDAIEKVREGEQLRAELISSVPLFRAMTLRLRTCRLLVFAGRLAGYAIRS
jgi:hypothetical protein